MTNCITGSRSKPTDIVTGLVAIKPRSVVDEYRVGADGKIERVSPSRCFVQAPFREKVSNVYQLSGVLKKYKNSKNTSLSRYTVEESFRRDTALVPRLHAQPEKPATMEDRGCRFMVLDVHVVRPRDIAPPTDKDDMGRFNGECVTHIRSLLPAAFRDVTFVCQWRATAGMDGWDHLPLRIWIYCNRPIKAKAIWRWAKANDPDGINDVSANSALYIPVGSPVFKKGVADPTFGKRLGLSKGASDVAELSIPRTKPKKAKRKKPSALPTDVAEALQDVADASNWTSHPVATRLVKQTLDKLRDALPHERLALLLDAATEAGRLIAGDHLSVEDAYQKLADAAEQWKLDPDQTEEAIVKGLHAGAAEQKDVPVSPKEKPARDLLDLLAPWDATERYMSFPEPEPGVYLLRCDLGSGKTEQMARLAIQTMQDYGSVLVVVHRRTLALAMAGRFRLPCYLTELEEAAKAGKPYKIEGSAVISVDSLWRVELEAYDLIVIEESESVFQHFFSGTLPHTDGNGRRSSGTCWSHLTKLCRRCLDSGGTVIGADALASWLSVSGLEILCEAGIVTNVKIVTHQLSRAETTIHRYSEKNDLIAQIVEQARLGKRCYISCTWRKDAEEIARLLADEGISVRCYTSETDPTEREDLKDVEGRWPKYQVIISSPAVDTGVSYDVDPRFEFVALIANHTGRRGLGWPSLLQMTARVRGATELHCYVAGRHAQSLDSSDIDAAATARVEATETYAEKGTWETGVRKEHEDDHHFVAGVVEQYQRCVTHDVAAGFYGWWRLRGATVLRGYAPVSQDQSAECTSADAVKKALKKTRETIQSETISRQAAAPVMSPSEYSDARRQEPRSVEERDSLKVTELAHLFGRDVVEDVEVAEVLLEENQRNRLTREQRNFVIAGLIWDAQWLEATRRDGQTAASGYRPHFEGYSASIHASIVVAECLLGREFLVWYFGPPPVGDDQGGRHLSCIKNNTIDVWTTPGPADEQRLYAAIRSAASALGLTDHDLERCGARLAPGGYAKFVGTHLRRICIRTTSKRPRKGKRRTTEYSVDLQMTERTQRLAAVHCARARGWSIKALDPEFTGTEWQAAVRDGRWVMPPEPEECGI